MDSRGQVSLGRAGTGAAEKTNVLAFTERQIYKDDAKKRRMDQDLRKIKATNRKLGEKALGLLLKTNLPHWNSQSTKDIKSELKKFKDVSREALRNDVNFYDDPKWIDKEQRLQDLILMEGDQKGKYISSLSALQDDKMKGDGSKFNYDQSLKNLERYADATHEEREEMDLYKMFVPREKEFSKDDFFSQIKPADTKIVNDNPDSKSTVSKPDVESMTAQAELVASTPGGQAIIQHGIEKGYWKNAQEAIDQSVDHNSKLINKDSSYTVKKQKSPKLISKGKLTDQFKLEAAFDVPITNASGRNYSSPIVMETKDLNQTIPAGPVINSKDGKPLKNVQNVKLVGGQLIRADDFEIYWKGTALREGAGSEGNRIDVMVKPEYIPNKMVKSRFKAMQLYLEELDKPATEEDF